MPKKVHTDSFDSASKSMVLHRPGVVSVAFWIAQRTLSSTERGAKHLDFANFQT